MIRPLALTRVGPLQALSALLFVGGVAVYTLAMWPRIVSGLLLGPICSGHRGAFALHCPACHAAAALIAAAAAAGLLHITRERGSATSP